MNRISHKFTTAQLLLTEAQFCAWIGQSAPGTTIQYHCGFLAIDTVRASSNLLEHERKELVRVGRRAWWAFKQGLGRYQIVRTTLRAIRKTLKLPATAQFDAEMQDRCACYLPGLCGIDKYLAGCLSEATLINNLTHEWASLPTTTGK